MSNCSNCYNGCTEIVSDRCVKYTGIDVPVLGIQTGDSLSFVEQALITFLTSTLDGTGIKIDLTPTVICNLVQQYLPTCGDLTIVDISKALIEVACDLQLQIDAIVTDIVTINNELNVIEADYTVRCLTVATPSITPSSGTHAILQATIDTLCALALDLSTNYVSIANIDTYIAAYISGSSSLVSAKMIPYVAVPYFNPDLSNFDGTGAGIGNWAKIYLCNGANPGVPDLRGRVLVGTTTGMNGGSLNTAVDPALGNPPYSLGTTTGVNQVTLGTTQIPSHTHAITNVVNVTDPGHTHALSNIQNHTNNFGVNGFFDQALGGASSGLLTTSSTTGITVSVNSSASNFGGNLPHQNNQPAIGCYYIIYIP
jgi:microcystin-dependent protein